MHNLTLEQRADFADLRELLCFPYSYSYFGILFIIEAFSLLYFILARRAALRYAQTNAKLVFLTALLWGLWPILFRVEYAGNRFCIVRFGGIIAAVVSIWQSLTALILFFTSFGQEVIVLKRSHRIDPLGDPEAELEATSRQLQMPLRAARGPRHIVPLGAAPTLSASTSDPAYRPHNLELRLCEMSI
jgi:hypothetical protein